LIIEEINLDVAFLFWNIVNSIFIFFSDSSQYLSLITTVRQTDGIVFGFLPNANPPLISLLTWTFFTATVIVVLICLMLVMRDIFKVCFIHF
jgi:hypothetical protein